LTALLDGELAAPHAERVRHHVDGCPECRDQLASLERTVRRQRDLLPRLSGVAELPVDEMLRRVRGAMDERQVQRRWWMTPQIVVGAAACAVLVFAFLRSSEPLLVAVGLEDPPEIVAEKPDLFRDYTLFENFDTIEHLEVGAASPAESSG
jgi:anti-sigma factor RsiW